jgi:hypothetical protein
VPFEIVLPKIVVAEQGSGLNPGFLVKIICIEVLVRLFVLAYTNRWRWLFLGLCWLARFFTLLFAAFVAVNSYAGVGPEVLDCVLCRDGG